MPDRAPRAAAVASALCRGRAGMTLRLAATEYGTGPALAILHGLFGSGRNWASVAQRLAAQHRVVALDLRNHGASPWAEAMDYAAMAEDVRATMQALGHRRYALLGHSMGGKAAMMLALMHRDEVERLVVADIAPAAYAPRHLGYVRAMAALDLAIITRRGEAEALLVAAVPDPAERAFLVQNLVFEEGRARWRLNLAAIERAMPTLVDFPALPAGAVYRGPALFVAGSRSDYLRPEHEPAIRRLFPAARLAHIAGAGHWVHAERPREFLALVESFLAAATEVHKL
jgi:pimeloyl-ACP methyl ester carboxylesterase